MLSNLNAIISTNERRGILTRQWSLSSVILKSTNRKPPRSYIELFNKNVKSHKGRRTSSIDDGCWNLVYSYFDSTHFCGINLFLGFSSFGKSKEECQWSIMLQGKFSFLIVFDTDISRSINIPKNAKYTPLMWVFMHLKMSVSKIIFHRPLWYFRTAKIWKK